MDLVSLNKYKNRLFDLFGKHKDYVVFAYLFGSMANETTPLSGDIDIAVFLQRGKSNIIKMIAGFWESFF